MSNWFPPLPLSAGGSRELGLNLGLDTLIKIFKLLWHSQLERRIGLLDLSTRDCATEWKVFPHKRSLWLPTLDGETWHEPNFILICPHVTLWIIRQQPLISSAAGGSCQFKFVKRRRQLKMRNCRLFTPNFGKERGAITGLLVSEEQSVYFSVWIQHHSYVLYRII